MASVIIVICRYMALAMPRENDFTTISWQCHRRRWILTIATISSQLDNLTLDNIVSIIGIHRRRWHRHDIVVKLCSYGIAFSWKIPHSGMYFTFCTWLRYMYKNDKNRRRLVYVTAVPLADGAQSSRHHRHSGRRLHPQRSPSVPGHLPQPHVAPPSERRPSTHGQDDTALARQTEGQQGQFPSLPLPLSQLSSPLSISNATRHYCAIYIAKALYFSY